MLRFTPREISLMRELVSGAGGASDKEIGHRLGITRGAVKEYFFFIRRKIGVTNRTELALWIDRGGIISSHPDDHLQRGREGSGVGKGERRETGVSSNVLDDGASPMTRFRMKYS